MRVNRSRFGLAGLLAAGCLAAVTIAMSTGALAQAGRPEPPFQPGGPGGFGPGGPGGFRPGFPGGPMPQMVATTTRVYILRGRTLYAFDAGSLKLVAQTEVPEPQGGPGGPPPRAPPPPRSARALPGPCRCSGCRPRPPAR